MILGFHHGVITIKKGEISLFQFLLNSRRDKTICRSTTDACAKANLDTLCKEKKKIPSELGYGETLALVFLRIPLFFVLFEVELVLWITVVPAINQ